MPSITLHRITVAHAEEAISEIWNCLEEYDIRSPAMACNFDGPDLTIQLHFVEPLGAELVNQRLCAWFLGCAAEARQSGAPPALVSAPEYNAKRRQCRNHRAAFYPQPMVARAR
jgi:hypothetical protein